VHPTLESSLAVFLEPYIGYLKASKIAKQALEENDQLKRALLEHLKRFCLYLQMKPVATKTEPYIGVWGEEPIEKNTKALEHAKTLGKQ
jgi:aspartate ammonia-lyase